MQYLWFILLLAIYTPSQAAQVVLQWDANNPTPQGYRIFQRSENGQYNYLQPVWTGTATTTTIENLFEGVPYYFVARAFVGSDESGDSNEVMFIAPVIPIPVITPVPSSEPTPMPPKCFPISGSAGFISTIAPGEYTIKDNGKLWTLTIVDVLPKTNFSGNIITKTFHREECRYYKCLTCTANFVTREAAIAAGYKPCGTCKP